MVETIPFKGKAVVYNEGDKKMVYIQLDSGSLIKLDEELVDHIPKIHDAEPAEYRSEALRLLMYGD